MFKLYDEHLPDLPASEELYTIKPVGLLDKMKGIFSRDEYLSLNISDDQVKEIKISTNKIDDGEW